MFTERSIFDAVLVVAMMESKGVVSNIRLSTHAFDRGRPFYEQTAAYVQNHNLKYSGARK